MGNAKRIAKRIASEEPEWLEGYRAFSHKDVHRKDNPYPVSRSPNEHNQWLDGFNEAERHFIDEERECGCDVPHPRSRSHQRLHDARLGCSHTPSGRRVAGDLRGDQRDDPRARLEYLRGELRAERISYGEIAELQSLVKHISPGDVELLEAAGVPEDAARIAVGEIDVNQLKGGLSVADLLADLQGSLKSSLGTIDEIHATSGDQGLQAWKETITRMVASLYRGGVR